jgi:hypothetical protein
MLAWTEVKGSEKAYVECQVGAIAEMYSLEATTDHEVGIIGSDNSTMSIMSWAVGLCQGINTLVCNV